jgi:hypothetical protein
MTWNVWSLNTLEGVDASGDTARRRLQLAKNAKSPPPRRGLHHQHRSLPSLPWPVALSLAEALEAIRSEGSSMDACHL